MCLRPSGCRWAETRVFKKRTRVCRNARVEMLACRMLLQAMVDSMSLRFKNRALVSRSRCGREIARLRRLAAVVAASRGRCELLAILRLSPQNASLGVPPWSLLLSKKHCDFEVFSLRILVFRRTFGSIWPNFDPVLTNSDLFRPIAGRTWPIFTYFDLFRRADLTYFNLFRFAVRLHGRDT